MHIFSRLKERFSSLTETRQKAAQEALDEQREQELTAYRAKLKAEQAEAFEHNIALFETQVIPKVRSNPKRFGIVVATRYKWWNTTKERNENYVHMAHAMQRYYTQSKATVCFGHNNSLVAFMLPTKMTPKLRRDIKEATEGYGAFKLYHFRYYRAKP